MARYKTCNYAQMKMVAVSYEHQILPGTFEHTLNHLIDHAISGVLRRALREFKNAIAPPQLQTTRYPESAAIASQREKAFSTDSLCPMRSCA